MPKNKNALARGATRNQGEIQSIPQSLNIGAPLDEE